MKTQKTETTVAYYISYDDSEELRGPYETLAKAEHIFVDHFKGHIIKRTIMTIDEVVS